MTKHQPLRILYNDACPVCAFEVRHHEAHGAGRGVAFEKLSEADLAVWGVDADQGARRLHAIEGDHMLEGFDANVAMWRRLPVTRPLAWIVTRPGLRTLARATYERGVAPMLYGMHRRREARASRGRN
ncbi:MAG: thiol-disulfide oxidoreductase DCC family protein [Paracoccaceae bacterium]